VNERQFACGVKEKEGLAGRLEWRVLGATPEGNPIDLPLPG